jgi:hypothetical protein
MAPSLVVAPGRPFVHLLLHLADLGGKAVGYVIEVIVFSSGKRSYLPTTRAHIAWEALLGW